MKNNELNVEMSPELAEFVGIMFGDGSLFIDKKYSYRISVHLNLIKDYEYSKHVRRMFFNIFNKELVEDRYEYKSSLDLRTYSKQILFFLHTTLNVHIGKKQLTSIPICITSDKKYLICFLRGLFDTDGCVVISKRNKSRPITLKICTAHNKFAKSIHNSLNVLCIKSNIYSKTDKYGNKGYDISITGINALNFVDLIGSNNPRNLIKLEKYGATGIRTQIYRSLP